MNYRHAFHAGNFADVVKHAVLALLLERLKAKDTPFLVIDTHAGIGRYDLSAPEAQKTGEFLDGIGRLLAAPADSLPAELGPYLAVVRAMNAGMDGLRWYPGSPRLALDLLRPQDRLVLCELHPADAATLAALFSGDGRVRVRDEDGYAALKALLPPKERRGLVLIDPPFERRDEFQLLAQALRQAHRRFATGQFLLWYPIKGRAPVAAFHDELRASGIARILLVEFLLRAPDDPERLNGCGLVLVNPPWQTDAALREMFPRLAALLGASATGGARIDWLGAAPAS